MQPRALCLFLILIPSCVLSRVLFKDALPPYCGHDPEPNVEQHKYQLRQVQVVIRHGDRTPWSAQACWENDTGAWNCSTNELSTLSSSRRHLVDVDRVYRRVNMRKRMTLHGNCMTGQLTTHGFRQEVKNGQALRQLYVDTGFLHPQLEPHHTFFRSCDEHRTYQSAMGVLFGLYPPHTQDAAQVVDVHTMDLAQDDMEPNAAVCPHLGDIQKQGAASPEFKKHTEEVSKPLAETLSSMFKISVSDAMQSMHVFDCVNTHICHKLDVPEGFTEDLYWKVHDEAVYQLVQNSYSYPNTTYSSALGIGFLLREIHQQMNLSVSNDATAKKFYLYSGHDTTLMPLLVALQAFDNKWVGYASTLVFELYTTQKSDSFFVRTLFNFKPVVLSGCEEFCPFEKFVKRIAPILFMDVAKECQTRN